MELSMTVLRCPDQIAPETRTVSGGEFHVGRGPDVDWVLHDPDRLLSKRHFAVAFRAGAWQIADTSTNGTFLNSEQDCIGRGAIRTLRDGDRIRVGAYEIELRMLDQPGYGEPRGGMADYGGAPAKSGQNQFGDPFAEDLLAPPTPPRRPFDEPAWPDRGLAPSAQLPHDFDPLAPDRGDLPFGADFRGPVQSDHSPLMEDALVPPHVAGFMPPSAASNLIPDDWDNLLDDINPPAAETPAHQVPASPMPPARPPAGQTPFEATPPTPPVPHSTSPAVGLASPPAAPVVRQLPPRQATPPASGWNANPFQDPSAAASEPPVPTGSDADPFRGTGQPEPLPTTASPFAEPEPQPAVPPRLDEHLVSAAARATIQPALPAQEPGQRAQISDSGASPFDEPSDRPQARPAASHPAPNPPAVAAALNASTATAPGETAAALAAFFQGAELSGVAPANPLAMMTGLGEAFRALVTGLRQVMIARAAIKGEFRIEQTMIRARGNNPLKFSANDDDALTALLGVGRRTDMAPAAAIEDSLRDLRLHELATMTAMQVAVRAMLDELNPDKIRANTDQGGMALLPAQRKARAWDVFEARHGQVVQALVDDFDSVFGKSFARAYERALDEIQMRERQ